MLRMQTNTRQPNGKNTIHTKGNLTMQMTQSIEKLQAELGNRLFVVGEIVTLASTGNTYTIVKVTDKNVTLER